MRITPLLAVALLAGLVHTPQAPADARPNPNMESAGTLRDGALTVALEAKSASWHPNGDAQPGQTIAAFAEEGKPASIPGPLIRAPLGTEIRLSVRNSLTIPIIFLISAGLHDAKTGVTADSVIVAPSAIGTLTTRATVAGNFVYRAMAQSAPRQSFLSSQLVGGVVIDSSATALPPHDRVFVMTEDFVPRRAAPGEPAAAPGDGRLAFMINGLSWPNTEKIRATVGDTLHWRIINASAEIHPMHLHGFYFRVDDFTPPASSPEIRGGLGRHVVTERMPQLTGMSIAWSPDRSGNWIFHCHFARHIEPVDSTGHGDHATTGMGGLVLGIDVANKPNARAIASAAPKRRLRLVAIADSGFRATEPSLRFVLEERGKRMSSGPAFSPTIELVRGEPVSITVVNQLREPTAVHWHGIELESYNDGVPGVSGAGTRVAPIITPRDSFEVRFTPPRAGTFMYHSHVDEVRQQPAGLAGALIVREPGEAHSADDHVFFIKGTRVPEAPSLIEVNGVANPDTVVFTQGRPTRVRVIGLASTNSNSAISLTARHDSSFANLNDPMILSWRQLAKDAFELPAAERVLRPARQVVGMGETFDFEFIPAETGNLRLEVRTYGNAGNLLARVPIKIVAPR